MAGIIFTLKFSKANIQNLVKNDPVVLEKSMFSLSYENNLCQGQEKTLTLQTHIPLLQLVVCIYKLASKAAINSEKSTVLIFSFRKAYVTKSYLAVK